jgi:hypothetical protein
MWRARNRQYVGSRKVDFVSIACSYYFCVIFKKTGNVYINVILRRVRLTIVALENQ